MDMSLLSRPERQPWHSLAIMRSVAAHICSNSLEDGSGLEGEL